MSPEADAKAKHLVDQLGTTFVSELKTARERALNAGIDYETGEIWSGVEARDVGLVDSIGTLEDVVSLEWGLEAYDFGPLRQSAGLLSGLAASALGSAAESLVAPFHAPRVR